MSFSHSSSSTTSELNMMCDAYEVACERLGIAQSDDIMRKRVGKLAIEQSRLDTEVPPRWHTPSSRRFETIGEFPGRVGSLRTLSTKREHDRNDRR